MVLYMAKRRILLAIVFVGVVGAGAAALTQPWVRPQLRTVAVRSAVVASARATAPAEPSPSAAATPPKLVLGTDVQPDHTTPLDLQAELDSVHLRGGGVVTIPIGNWSLATTISVWSDTTLQGAGRQSCLVMRQPGVDLLNVAGSNVTLENFCLVGPGGVATHGGNGPGRGVVNLNKIQTIQSVVVRNLKISFTQGHAVELYGSPRTHLRGLTVEGNVISRAGGHGIVMGFTDGGRVASNLVVESALGGMAYGDGAVNIEGSAGLTIDGNTVDGSMYSGLQANSLAGSIIRNNTVSNTQGSGFAFWNCSGDTFQGNTAIGNTDQGFYWALNSGLPGSASNNLIQANLAQRNGQNGFQLAHETGVQFTGNSAIDNNTRNVVASGLMLQQNSSTITVSGNTFKNSHPGLGQLLGVHDVDKTAIGLVVTDDNVYSGMRVANIQL